MFCDDIVWYFGNWAFVVYVWFGSICSFVLIGKCVIRLFCIELLFVVRMLCFWFVLISVSLLSGVLLSVYGWL